MAGLNPCLTQRNAELTAKIFAAEDERIAAEKRSYKGSMQVIGGITLIGVGGACIIFTGGVATPVVITGYVAGGGTAAFGVAEATEGVQEISYGNAGDGSNQAFNFIRDTVFQGNQDAYNLGKDIFTASATGMIPVGLAGEAAKTATWGQMARIVTTETVSTVAGKESADVVRKYTHNELLATVADITVSMTSSIGFEKALQTSARKLGSKYSTNVSKEMESKILAGRRVRPNKNEVVGGHSPKISDDNDLYVVEILSTNSDGTINIKFIKDFQDGTISKIKKSTIFPKNWNDAEIIEAVKQTGDSPVISTRASDGATFHRQIINGIEIDVIKKGNDVVSGFPTGKVGAPFPVGF